MGTQKNTSGTNAKAVNKVSEGIAVCVACGNTILDTDQTCPKCLTPQSRQKVRKSQKGNPGVSSPKSKTAAVLLAVFLSFWTWLYTYKKNAIKFWIALGVSILIGVPLLSSGTAIGFLLSLGIQIWAIIDVSVKPSEFYKNYRK